jgi:hypothetical protein
MNIFFLDQNPHIAAQYHADKHTIKMILETAQLLSTAHRLLDNDNVDQSLYKKTHMNHPCSIWVRTSSHNYQWTYSLFQALCNEYTFRYNKQHKSEIILLDKLAILPKNIPTNIGMTFPALAMPDEYKSSDPVESYRKYYIEDKIKKNIAQWNKTRNKPNWVYENV